MTLTTIVNTALMPNLHCKGVTDALLNLKWHLDYILVLLTSGINAFTKQFQLSTLILGAEVGQSRQNLVWLLCGIVSLH